MSNTHGTIAQAAPCCVYDFTMPGGYTPGYLKDFWKAGVVGEQDNQDPNVNSNEFVIMNCLRQFAKKIVFQLEIGAQSGYVHYQGRISLKLKARINNVIQFFDQYLPNSRVHISLTSTHNKGNDFYCVKNDTRMPGNESGPWKDTDIKLKPPAYIPKQVRMMKQLYPYQQSIIDQSKIFDTRHIDFIIDMKGNRGKSSIVLFMEAYAIGTKLPFINSMKDLMRMVCDKDTSTCYLVDLPRALTKDRLREFFCALEEIKSGMAYDDRYKYKTKLFDCPSIWCFTNKIPNLSYLSWDRWRLWRINEENELVSIPLHEAKKIYRLQKTQYTLADDLDDEIVDDTPDVMPDWCKSKRLDKKPAKEPKKEWVDWRKPKKAPTVAIKEKAPPLPAINSISQQLPSALEHLMSTHK